MLDSEDKQYISEQIGSQLKQNNKEIIVALGEFLEQNILPRIDNLERTVSTLPTKEYIDKIADNLETKIANLPTKQYLDDKLADAVSDTVNLIDKRFAKRDALDKDFKTTVTEVVEEHDLATPSQLSTLKKSISLNTPLTA